MDASVSPARYPYGTRRTPWCTNYWLRSTICGRIGTAQLTSRSRDLAAADIPTWIIGLSGAVTYFRYESAPVGDYPCGETTIQAFRFTFGPVGWVGGMTRIADC